MVYPILPLTPTWGNPEQEQVDIAKTKYGKAGVEQRDFIGINPVTTSWDINVNIINFQEVEDFLRSRRGQPFRLSLDGGTIDDGKFYICTEWQIQQLGMGVSNFSAKINEVRRLVIEFVPPPPPNLDIVFFLSGDGVNGYTNFSDFYNSSITVNGNPIYSNNQNKWNETSIYFGGDGDYLTINNNSHLNFGDGDFTIEGWVYFTSMPGIFNIYKRFTGYGNTSAGIDIQTGNLVFWVDIVGAVFTGSTRLTTGQWYHIAVVRENSNLRGFINGILDGFGLINSNIDFSNSCIGHGYFNSDFCGYIDGLRIAKKALYTANFTPNDF